MATKQEIIAAIREGIEQVERTFGALNDEQLRVKVHESDGGWTAKEILAHLAGRARGYETMRNLAPEIRPPAEWTSITGIRNASPSGSPTVATT